MKKIPTNHNVDEGGAILTVESSWALWVGEADADAMLTGRVDERFCLGCGERRERTVRRKNRRASEET